MSGLSIIIPSRNAVNLHACVTAIRKAEETCRILVINDGLEQHPALDDSNLTYIQGVKPFVFARNCNLGIDAAGADDVILLNDDALIESPGGFTRMQDVPRVLNFGIISATTNLAGNPAQQRQPGQRGIRRCGAMPGHSAPVVAFVCVLITRECIKRVGLLDEEFTAYGWDDNSYCRRAHLAGFKIGICDGCYVDHAKLTSTFRGQAYAAGDINAGREIYLKKWGNL